MSNFSEHVIPNLSLEELVQLRIAMQLYVELLQQRPHEEKSLPIATSMYRELAKESQRRFSALGVPAGPAGEEE